MAPKAMKAVVAAGLGGFALLAVGDVGYGPCVKSGTCGVVSPLVSSILYLNQFFKQVTFARPLPPIWDTQAQTYTGGSGDVGLYAFLLLLAATVAFALWHANLGSAMLDLAAPATLALMLALLILDYGEMTVRATNFAGGLEVYGFPLLSNWTALVVSGGLTAWGASRRPMIREWLLRRAMASRRPTTQRPPEATNAVQFEASGIPSRLKERRKPVMWSTICP